MNDRTDYTIVKQQTLGTNFDYVYINLTNILYKFALCKQKNDIFIHVENLKYNS